MNEPVSKMKDQAKLIEYIERNGGVNNLASKKPAPYCLATSNGRQCITRVYYEATTCPPFMYAQRTAGGYNKGDRVTLGDIKASFEVIVHEDGEPARRNGKRVMGVRAELAECQGHHDPLHRQLDLGNGDVARLQI